MTDETADTLEELRDFILDGRVNVLHETGQGFADARICDFLRSKGIEPLDLDGPRSHVLIKWELKR